jgi:hypothetical protein
MTKQESILEPKKLTVKEALEQGYTYYTFEGDEEQYLLSEIEGQDDFIPHDTFLVSKEPVYFLLDKEEFKDDFRSRICLDDEFTTNDHSFDKKLKMFENMLDAFTDLVNSEMSNHPVYYASNIRLCDRFTISSNDQQ